MFFKGSRYTKVEDLEITGDDGRVIRYKKVRFIPRTEASLSHVVRDHERIDHIAHQHFKDSQRFWRICDANLTMRPNELVERSGRRIQIPPPEG